jgi:ribosomal protein S18 acetylase RimI-like enzyme
VTAARIATEADFDAVVRTITAAFQGDPLWTWMFPDPERRVEQHRKIFSLYVESAIPGGFVWVTDEDAAAAAIWTTPGGRELTDEAEAVLEPYLTDVLGPRAPAVLETFHRFEAAAPKDPPFYYLSFLGTHPDHRGRGIGMSLLAENLERIDAAGRPAYLESSNPANNHRYETLGFKPYAEFSTPGNEHTVTTMWREACRR